MGEIVVDTLLEARELMNDGGKHWIQGDFHRWVTERGECHCALGAVYRVARTTSVESACARALAETLVSYGFEEGNITKWNDMPERTWEDVSNLFLETVERLRGDEDG